MRSRVLLAGVIASLAAVVLTGCNPPMPESLKVELAERTVQCGESFVDLAVFPEMADVADFWNGSMDTACAGSMGANLIDGDLAGNGLQIAAGELTCEAYASVPVAVDAAVVSFYFEEIYELNLSSEAVAGIFSGSVTNWNDPVIADLNPNVELPDLPINVIPEAPAGAISAMEFWVGSLLGETVEFSLLTPSDASEVDALYALAEGDIKLTSFAALQVSGMGYANFVKDASDLETLLLPDTLTIQTAIGQTVVSGEDPNLSFSYDPSIEALPLPGQFEALLPWGAIYPVTLGLCGEDDLQTRYVARYMLRLDAQGSISTGVFSPLKEEVRVAAISVVDDGLPEVEIPTDLELEQ
ncbi:MAG: hypothetical protein RLZ65_1067 [Actinomycetota bacterium]